MAESLPGRPDPEGAPKLSPGELLRSGAEEAGRCLNELEESVLRDRKAVGALADELAKSVRELHYERGLLKRDRLVSLATFLSPRVKGAQEGLGVLLDQVTGCQRLRDKPPDLMEGLALLETELAPYAQALAEPGSAGDASTPYGAFIPMVRILAEEAGSVRKELGEREPREDFVERSMFRKYREAVERLGGLLAAYAAPPYADYYARISAAREKLMRAIVAAKARADPDSVVLRGVQQVKTDLDSEFERIEMMFTELSAAKNREAPPAPAAASPHPAGEATRRRGLFGRLRK